MALGRVAGTCLTIEKDQPVPPFAQEWRAAHDPVMPGEPDIRPPALLRYEAFLYESPARTGVRWIEESCTDTPCVRSGAPASSFSVMSGSAHDLR